MLYGVVVSCVLLAPLRHMLALTFALPSQVRNSSIHLIVLIFGVGLLPLVLQCGVLCVKGCCGLRGECLLCEWWKSLVACSRLPFVWFPFVRPTAAIRLYISL